MKIINFDNEIIAPVNKIVAVEKRNTGDKFFIRTYFGTQFWNDTDFSSKEERDSEFERLKRFIEKTKG